MSRLKYSDRVLLVEVLLGVLTVCCIVNFTAMHLHRNRSSRDAAAQARADSLAIARALSPAAPEARWLTHLDSLPGHCVKLRTDRSLNRHKLFNDSNYHHLRAARALGIEPIADLDDCLAARRCPVKIVPCREYWVDSLHHSLPYLVPEAADLLRQIGQAFNDSLAARGGGDYRIKVTSMLRTLPTVERLRRRNGNAVARSAHLWGTTFDLSYSNFVCDAVAVPRTTDDLAALLTEILARLRSQGLCWVKHERRQSCFHITVRPAPQQ